MATVAPFAGERAPRWPSTLVVLAASAAGLLSGLRIFLTYNAGGARISVQDGIASGLMSWWLWVPFVPAMLALARRLDPSRGRPLRALVLHVAFGIAVALAHLSLFSFLSGVVRLLRYGIPLRFDLASPLGSMLAPDFLVYCGVVALAWWRPGHAAAPAPPARQDRPLCFRAGKQLLFLRADEVDWVAAAGNYLELHAGAATHLVRETLKGVHERLGPGAFVRIHRSTLVRRDAVLRLAAGKDEARVVLRDGTELAVGRKYRGELAALVPAAPSFVPPGPPPVPGAPPEA